MSLDKSDLETIASIVAAAVAAQTPTPQPEPAKATAKVASKAAAKPPTVTLKRNLDPETIAVDGSPVSFRVLVSDYMLREGKSHQYSARFVPIVTDKQGKESVQRSMSAESLSALLTDGTAARIAAAIDTVNKRAKLGKYAPQPSA